MTRNLAVPYGFCLSAEIDIKRRKRKRREKTKCLSFPFSCREIVEAKWSRIECLGGKFSEGFVSIWCLAFQPNTRTAYCPEG